MANERRVLISAALFHALNDSATVAVPMIFPLLYSQRHLIKSYSQIGLLSNFGLLTTFLFQILIVQASRRYGYRALLGLSFAGISLSLVLISFSSTFAFLFFLYLLFRIFDSFYHTIGLAWVSRTHPSHGIDLAMGIQSGSGNLGVCLAFIAVGFLAQTFNWQQPLRIWAVACFLMGLASFLLVRRISFSTEDLDSLTFSSWLQTISRIRSYVLGFVFGGASWSVTVYFAPSLLNHKFQIPMGKTGLYLALWIGIGTITTYLFGVLSRRLGRSRVFKIGFFGASLSLLLLGFSAKPALAIFGLCSFGMFLFLIYPALQSYVGNAVPMKNQAQAFSVVSNLQMISGAFVSLIAGFLSDEFGINTPFIILGFLGAGASLLSVFSLIRGKKSRVG